MLGKDLLIGITTILFALSFNNANAGYDASVYCPFVPVGTKFPSLVSCQNYYTCNANGLAEASSCATNESFDKDSQSCKDAASVKCGVAATCDGKDKEFLAITGDCRGWIYCANNTESNRGNCPPTTVFKSGECVYGQCITDSTTAVLAGDDLCSIMQDGQFFGDSVACTNWFKCKDSVIQSGVCLNDLVYNSERRMCVKDDKNIMCDRIAASTDCSAEVEGALKVDEKVCSNYYKCISSVWEKQQCATGQYFDEIELLCKDRISAKTVVTCNRCEFTTLQWVNAVDAECLKYQTCSNGLKIADNGTCGTGQYFNELRQACVLYDSTSTSLSDYKTTYLVCA